MKNYGQFHDGFFEGLWISGKEIVHVFLSTSKKERATVVLTGLVMSEGKWIVKNESQNASNITSQHVVPPNAVRGNPTTLSHWLTRPTA